MHILIVYASKAGQTAKIAEHIAKQLRSHDTQVNVMDANAIASDFQSDTYDAIIVGGPIHVGKFPAQLKNFISRNRDNLNRKPSAFFTVCLAIHSQHANEQEQARNFGPRFVQALHWQPLLMDTFAGAVKYTQYNFITRYVMKQISRREGGSTDTSRDHEYTDWNTVTAFAEQFLMEINKS